jgi:hypothetical protein
LSDDSNTIKEKIHTHLELLFSKPQETFDRWLTNQKKLYSETLPRMILGDVLQVYHEKSFFAYQNKLLYFIFFIPLIIALY